ncbi:MAG TPA: hypothetical protein VHD36_20070 [Pirellulales bacterium]|nr:hypothetical protein [Pirellulales bacterium]
MAIKVFLSWSGDCSHKVALAFRDWLPSVIQSIQPYVSSEDIDKGTRWSTDIARELEASAYGIICVTKDNLNAPWLCFEAGALSKSIDRSNVTPFLFNIKRSDVHGPLLQFQSALNEKEEVFKIVKSINNRIDEHERIADLQLRKSFDVWWDHLAEDLMELERIQAANVEEVTDIDPLERVPDILEELLDLTRSQQRLLSDPDALFPNSFLNKLLVLVSRQIDGFPGEPVGFVSRTFRSVDSIVHLLADAGYQGPALDEAVALAESLNKTLVEQRKKRGGILVKDGKVMVRDGKVLFRSPEP